MKLLIVNDDKITANIMKTEIPWEHHDIEVYVAYNVPEGQAIISGNKIDLLLCDIEMPDENGIALIRWIREKQFDIDCIFLTCHADFNYAKEAITLNCQDYLLMPTSYENIINTVLKVVRRRTERLLNNQLQEYGKSWLNSQQQIISENKESTRTPRELVEECTAYILQNLNSENLSVNEIASHFYLNPIYLNRIFKKEKNIAISQFIIKEKMSLAAELLKNPDISAVSVANQLGYPNYSYFAHTFRKYYNCTPAQWHEKMCQ